MKVKRLMAQKVANAALSLAKKLVALRHIMALIRPRNLHI